MENGTHGRTWHTDEENNIAFSFFLKTNCKIEKIEGITIEIANTLTDVLKELYNTNLKIKYPNDIVIGNKKIGGILTQTRVQGEFVKCIVIGIGMNTNQKKFTKEISKIATSIKNEFNIEVDNKKIIAKFCELFEKKICKKEVV